MHTHSSVPFYKAIYGNIIFMHAGVHLHDDNAYKFDVHRCSQNNCDFNTARCAELIEI